MKILAAVVHGKGGPFQIEEAELTGPGPGEVLVRVAATGMCRTDIHARDGYFPIPYPAVYGHEGAGIVESVGAGVDTFRAGDPVVMVFPSCGKCHYCLNGKPSYCLATPRLKYLGTRPDGSTVMRRGGKPVYSFFFQQSSFATFSVATERNVVKAPDDIPLEILAAFPCGVNTGAGAVLNVLKPEPGSSLAVFGSGSVGMAAMMAARVAGCRPVIAVDVFPERLHLARFLGATHTVNASASDPVAAIREITEGKGVRFSVDAAGFPATLRDSVNCLQPLGTCCLVGSARRGTEAPLEMSVLQNGRSVRGCIQGDCIPDEFIPRLIQLYLEGKLPVDRMISFYPFEEINRAAADSLAGRAVKAVLRMPK
ncbi:MAG TPA: NAD(P)-dependent alcohol dehydrogenase [Thermodesulfobacteriota bacterium]|nr:NAD(P)-dependent alcohol dehydrogenase [Thermodesulfobacteriota bacterium]